MPRRRSDGRAGDRRTPEEMAREMLRDALPRLALMSRRQIERHINHTRRHAESLQSEAARDALGQYIGWVREYLGRVPD